VASGAGGGLPGARAESLILRADGTKEVIASKIVTTLFKHDRVIVQTAGGGGFGKPIARDRNLVAADVNDGKISRATAQSVYGYEPV
jgi:N-methylhydantoinase B